MELNEAERLLAAPVVNQEKNSKGNRRGETQGSRHHRWQPGQSGNPAGKPKGVKDKLTLINEAKINLLADILSAQPDKRFYKRWLKNYAVRHPKEALELIGNITQKFEGKDKGDTHLHFNLAALVAAAGKKEEEQHDRV